MNIDEKFRNDFPFLQIILISLKFEAILTECWYYNFLLIID